MSLAVVITTTGAAHPERLANASALQEHITHHWAVLGLPCSRYACWLHLGGDGLWPDTRAALANALSAGFDHILLLQDDIRLHPDFMPAMHGCVAARPDAIWSGFTRHKRLGLLAADQFQWAEARILTNAPCVCYPALALHEMLTWVDANVRPDFASYDQRVSLWTLATGRSVFYTVPCLVQHDEGAFGSVYQPANHYRLRVAGAFWPERPLPNFQSLHAERIGPRETWVERVPQWRVA